ncbi:hypothetical protein [Paenibacillus vietnamensis]|uniref:hypothetical protein n=1 Tax=Paenibacillus vietnamensis TaxID=2590547 RepID=UPI0037C6B5B6
MLKSFYDPVNSQVYKRGSEYECSDSKHIHKLAASGLIETPVIVINDEFPKHVGGGTFELSNGEKVRGKEAAEEAEKELRAG